MCYRPTSPLLLSIVPSTAPRFAPRNLIAKLVATAIIIAIALVVGCGKQPPAPIELPTATPSIPGGTTPGAALPDRGNLDQDNPNTDDGNPAPPPAGATVGEVVSPLPRPAPRLFDGSTTATALPDISCEELAPGKEFKLARKLEVVSLATEKGEADQTLELCLFNRWLPRTDPELPQRTGRKHHFVAAFPGTSVASWTTREVQRSELGLPDSDASGLGAGWAAVIATGVPQWPAVGVVSARFYGGELGEAVHYLRRGRVLLQEAGRWLWKPLTERAFATLDRAWLQGKCAAATNAETDACAEAADRIARYAKQADARAKVRQTRLSAKPGRAKGKRAKRGKKSRNKAKRGAPQRYPDDTDPHAAWLRDGRAALAAGNPKLAIRNVLRALVICGETGKDAMALIRAANKRSKVWTPRISPLQKAHSLCEPLPDKPAPRDRKK